MTAPWRRFAADWARAMRGTGNKLSPGTLLWTAAGESAWREALGQAAVIYDLDGVVVDVRTTYRRAYLRALQSFFRLTGGPEEGRRPRATLRAVHLLKRHPGFNDPAEVVAVLLRLALVAQACRQQDPRWVQRWIAAALGSDGLDRWREDTLGALSPAGRDRLLAAEDPGLVLALVREHYVGSPAMEAVFGAQPRLRVLGQARRDRLLADPARPASAPVAIYTGRTRSEALWLAQRYVRFAGLTAAASAGLPVAIEAVDTGAHKPDGLPLLRLADLLQTQTVVYVGDLPADRTALLDARRRDPGRRWLLAQVLTGPGAPRWPEADACSHDTDLLLGPTLGAEQGHRDARVQLERV